MRRITQPFWLAPHQGRLVDLRRRSSGLGFGRRCRSRRGYRRQLVALLNEQAFNQVGIVQATFVAQRRQRLAQLDQGVAVVLAQGVQRVDRIDCLDAGPKNPTQGHRVDEAITDPPLPGKQCPRRRLLFGFAAASHLALFAVIEGETEGIAEGDQRPFGSIGLGFFQRRFMRFAQGEGITMAAATTFADDQPVVGADNDAHSGDIGAGRAAGAAAVPNTLGLNGLAITAVETEDAAGLGDGMPALDVRDLDVVFTALAYPLVAELGLQRTGLRVGEAGHRVRTLMVWPPLDNTAPGTRRPAFRVANTVCRSSRAGCGCQ